MGVWGEGAGWCFCSGGGVRSERVKGSIFAAKGAALATISVAGAGGGGGTGFLIHRSLLLTTHATLPSGAAAEAAEIRLSHRRIAARLVPYRFFITSSILDLTIVGLDTMDGDSNSQGGPQPYYLKTCCNPSLDLGSVVYLLGHTKKNDLTIGEGKVVIATDNLIKLSTDGVTWCPGSAGFDVQGNLAFMVCDPMKLASSPTAKSSSASSSSSLSLKMDSPMQFGIPISVICDWLHQHWEGSLDEVSKPKLPIIRLMSSGQKSENSSASFTLKSVFKPTDGENNEMSLSSQIVTRPKYYHGSSSSTNAKVSHDENPIVDLRSSHEPGILTPEIYETPIVIPGPVRKKEQAPQLLDINFPPRVPRSIHLPLPLKQMLSAENDVEGAKDRNPSGENGLKSHEMQQANSEVQSSSSPVEISEFGNERDGFSSGEETMYSAETMESRNIPSPRENNNNNQQVGRSQSCVNYSRWASPRSTGERKGALQKQHTLIPIRKTQSQTTALQHRGHDYFSPTVSSSMKKRNSCEQPMRPRQSAVQVSPRWMF
ncbi:uncharacterized protein LOC109717833 [Ananas comosus]|uniref:Uncharacterized protein LOC109717833 n=2 Tax=Ananas comosus TaxID=4615 RepID=A0A6P5FST2_ANACO|nr:uncharacterized protein LOC109717833 [Ananas comosus]